MAKVSKKQLQEKNAKDKRTKLLTVIVVAFLIVVFVVGFIYGLNSVLAMEGAYPPNQLSESELKLLDSVIDEKEIKKAPQAQKENAYNALIDAVDYVFFSREPSFATSRSNRVAEKDGGYAITTTGSEELLTSLKLLAEDVKDSSTEIGKAVNSDYTEKTADFGEELNGLLAKPAFTLSDIGEVTCSYKYYQCPSCDETDPENCYETCPKCGSTTGYQLKYKDDFSVTMQLNNTEKVLKDNFAPRTEQQIKALFGEALNGKADISGVKVAYNRLSVSYVLDRIDLTLKQLSYKKEVTVTFELAFKGDFEALKTQTVTFDFEQTDSVNLTWPGLTLNLHEMNLEPKGEDNLLASLVCADPAAELVSWESSDPEIVKVDDEGYLKACKTDGQDAVITATFIYNYNVYQDSCVVHVRYPVESTSMSKTKAKLAAGETLSLSVKFSPKNATVKTVTWYSTDEKVAAVDENGTVTAIAAGEATVYSLSDDGYFKSSCKVTVQ